MKFNKIIIFVSLALTSISACIYYIYFIQRENKKIEPRNEKNIARNACLGDDEIANYKITKKKDEVSMADIVISDKKTGQEKSRFRIELPIPDHYHPIELHKCGVYATRDFNYDYAKKSTSPKDFPNYRIELWQYQYNGNGKSLIYLSGPISGSGFGTDFRIDFSERYLAFSKRHFGSSDYALVIKDLKTLKDVFTLSMTEIEKRNPEIIGNFELDNWTKDGRYFWAATHYGAISLGFIRIDATDWSYKLFPAPENVLGGDALNLENGYITVHPGNVWYGVEEIEQEEKAKRREQGIGTELYIHNLITNERKFINKTDEPLWFFKPKWISDNELQYELPTGEKKVYKIVK